MYNDSITFRVCELKLTDWKEEIEWLLSSLYIEWVLDSTKFQMLQKYYFSWYFMRRVLSGHIKMNVTYSIYLG